MRIPLLGGRGKRIRRAPNPWLLTQTFLDIDAGADGAIADREAFRALGVARLRNVVAPDEMSDFVDAAEAATGLGVKEYPQVFQGLRDPVSVVGGVMDNPPFWPLVWNPRLLRRLRSLVGNDLRFVGRDAVAMHTSSYGFHADNRIHSLLHGTDYGTDHSTTRVIFYLGRPGRPAARFGFQPFSHRVEGDRPVPPAVGRGKPAPVWLEVPPGDCVVFDDRLVHSGESLQGPKTMVVLTFDRDSESARRSFFEHRILREDAGYNRFPEAFAEGLLAKDLLLSRCLDTVEEARHRERLSSVQMNS